MNEESKYIPTALILAVFTLFAYFVYGDRIIAQWNISNIQLYICGVVLFFGVLFIGKLFERTAIGKKSVAFLNKVLIVGAIPGGGYWLYRAFSMEMDTWPYYPAGYLRHNIPGLIYLFVMCSGVVIALCMISRCKEKEIRTRVAVSTLVVFLQMWFLYTPNFFRDTLGCLYHIDAYTNSIINSLNYAPLEQYSCSIYGHYGILYILPVKFLQLTGMNQWIAVTLSIAIIGGCTFALEYWVFNEIIENDAVFILAVVGSAVVSVQIYHGQYYQMLPHRFVFPAVTLAGITMAGKRKGKLFRVFMWIMMGLAIVWNTETGVVCALVWMLGNIYMDAKVCTKYTLKSVCCNLIGLILVITGAYGFVNLYNLVVGGNTISFAEFLYPLGSKAYQIENLQLPLQKPWAGYFFPIMVLLCVLGYFLERIVLITVDGVQLIVIMAAILGIGVYTYYMNRAVNTNATIVSFPFIVVLSYIVDRVMKKDPLIAERKCTVFKISAFLCLIVMVSMVLSTVSTLGVTLTEKNQTIYETESLNQFMTEIQGKIPEDTVAFGAGTALLFAYMNRSTGIYIADWEDLEDSYSMMGEGNTIINQEALDYLIQKLQDNDYLHILVSTSQSQYIPQWYTLKDSFEYGGYGFMLYENTGNV